jgi:hypothetical protein
MRHPVSVATFEFWAATDARRWVLVPESMSTKVAGWNQPSAYERVLVVEAHSMADAHHEVARFMGWGPITPT